MKNYFLHDVNLAEYLWRDRHIDDLFWARALVGIDRRLRSIEPTVDIEHSGPGHISGCSWTFLVNAQNQGIGNSFVGWPEGTVARWKVAFSYRGPFITALSWTSPSLPEDAPVSLQLVSLVQEIASSLNLTYLDAHELMACEIPMDELQGDAPLRLDWSDTANAFNLLFYEY